MTANSAGELPPLPDGDFARCIAAARGWSEMKEAIYRASMDLFAATGYPATSLRQVAAEVGIEAASLYNHISSKEELLFNIVEYSMTDVIEYVRDATRPVRDDPAAALWTATAAHVAFHCSHGKRATVGNNELVRLSESSLAQVIELRETYERGFEAIIEDGVTAGVFREVNARLHTFAIMALGTSSAVWYDADGSLSPHEIGALYADFTLRATVTSTQFEALYGDSGKLSLGGARLGRADDRT